MHHIRQGSLATLLYELSPISPCLPSPSPGIAVTPLSPLVQAIKPVGVAAVAVLALYSRQPPSVMVPGDVITVNSRGLAACTFLPAPLRNGCAPLRAAVTESGSLVLFKGGNAAPLIPAAKGDSDAASTVSDSDVLWSSPAPKKGKFSVSHFFLNESRGGCFARCIVFARTSPCTFFLSPVRV